MAADLPANEAQRLAALQALALLDTPADPAFDGLTALAADLLDAPIALVSLVDRDHQWAKSHSGTDLIQVPRAWSFCAHALHAPGLFEVADATLDARFQRNPLVTGPANWRFYAGMPLTLDGGEAIGTLCVVDHRPRRLDARQKAHLSRLADQVLRLIDLHASRRAQALLGRDLQRLTLVVRRTKNVVIMADAQGRIIDVNPAFEHVTGYAADEAIGMHPGDLLQFESSSALAQAEFRDAIAQHRPCHVQILNRSKRGQPYWMDVDLQPLHNADGHCDGFVSIETDITDIVRQREQAQALLDVLPDGVLHQSTDGRIMAANPAAHEILGVPLGSLVGQTTRAVTWGTVDSEGQRLPDELRPLSRVLATGQPAESQHIGVRNGHGEQRWLNVRCVPLRGPDGRLEGALSCFGDVTEAVRTDHLLQSALMAADLGTWSWDPDDDNWTVSANWAERFGTGGLAPDWRSRMHADDLPRANEAMLALLRGQRKTYRAEFRFRMADGRWRWLLAHGAVAERASSGRVIRVSGAMMDIDERRRAEERLRRAATTDALTGLPNRSLLADRLGQALATCRRRQRQGALIYLDLDHFKRVNDSHGHAAGDELLREVTHRLRGALRTEDTLARMGGDELMVLLPDAGGDMVGALQAAQEVVRKLRLVLESPVCIAQSEFRVGASVGITVFPRTESPTVEDLIREADTAMYAAKQGERGSTRVYEPTMRDSVTHRLALERALRAAIEADELHLHLQGQWTANGELSGLEALVRWHDPERGQVSPLEFVPLAEECGLIVPLGRRVIEHACATARRLKQQGMAVPLSVNVSPRQFADAGFAAHLQASVRRHHITPQDLQLELTEGMLADEASEALMQQLASDGYRFSIDDFGTGWSNLMYLKRLPVHELKIDRAFVRDLETDADDAALVLAIIGIARRFGMRTVAEGVETAAQARFLVDAGCDRLQGWLFDRARPVEEVIAEPRRRPAVA